MDFNYEPFWDDFEASNGPREQNYMRILFRPGYAVQARELTQLQTIIQNQIKQFGNHIFKNGSPVYGGQMTLDKRAKYLKLEPQYNNIDIDVEDYLDRVVFNQSGTSRKRAQVITVYDGANPTLMIRMMTGNQFVAGETVGTSTGSLATVSPNPTGFGSVAHINEGVFYVNGFFVYVEPQTIVLDAYASNPSFRVGLEIEEEIVDEGADGNLLDPAQNSFNYQAPGAHRYRFGLALAKRSIESPDDERFFELLRVESGNITKIVSQTQYAAIEGLLARRTYDESGNYVVKPFSLELKANTSDDSKFIARVGEGKAYVTGYDYESTNIEGLDVNKARVYQEVADYDLSVGYGNYIITQDLKIKDTAGGGSMPDLSSVVTMDMHCVTTDKISYASAAAYNATYMGSASLINLDRSGTEFITYYNDITVSSNTITTPSGASSVTEIKFPSSHSSQDNAYKGVRVRVMTGSAAGDVRTITAYTGSTKTATVDTGFAAIIASGVKLELLYDKVNINSIINSKSSGTSANLTMNVSSRSKVTGTSNTIIGDVRKSSFIFPLSDKYVKYSSINNADYYFKKYISNKEFQTNGTTCVAGLSFTDGFVPFGTTAGSTVSAVAISEYIIVVNKTTGLVVTPSSVTVSSPSDISITVPGSSTFNADIYITLKADNSEYTTKRTKTIVGNSTTKTLSTGQLPSGTPVVNQSSVLVDTTNGFIWFKDNSVINKNLGGSTSLYVPDVFRIKAIFDSQNPSEAPTLVNSIDITDRFLLDSGQRDMYYDHSAIVLKPGSAPPTGQIVVLTQYFNHSTTAGWFGASSYAEEIYNNGTIPVYLSTSTGISYPLRDCIDFRPTRSPRTTARTFFGFKCIRPDFPMELSYAYYLSRIDTIVVTADRTLKVVEGTPAKKPIPPVIPNDSMELFTLNIPSYTPNVSTVKASSSQNRRYTMKDIGELEQRIDQLEYYTAMSLAEKDSVQKTILYSGTPGNSTKVGTEKEKYGILVDNFTDFNIADTYAYDYFAAIDGGGLLPVTEINSLDLEMQPYEGSVIKVNKRTITLPYTEVSAISQLYATSNVSVQPYLYGTFEGMLYVSPEIDTTHSFTLPPVIVDDRGTIVPKSADVVVSEASLLTSESKKKMIKNHIERWTRKVNKNYMAISQTFNDEAYNTAPNQTIRNL